MESGVATREVYNTPFVVAIATSAALGGLLFGYDWVVIGGAKPFFEKFFQLNGGSASGWANSCALIGCLIGSIASGAMSDRLGRKKLLVFSAAIFAASSILTGHADDFDWFVTWRICGGIAIGMASNISPMYIAEISPATWRGRLVSLNQFTVVIGVLAAQIVNWLIAQPVPANATAEFIRNSWNGQTGWRWMFYAVTVPSIVFFVTSLLVPESPRWLVKRGDENEAGKTLARIGGEDYGRRMLDEIRASLVDQPQSSAGLSELFAAKTLKIVVLGVVLAVLQQWCGINVIFNYAEDIYRNAGYGVSDIMFNIVITGAINMLFTFVALGTVDRFGRRALMLIGCAGIGLSHTLLGVAYFLGLKGLPVVILTLSAIGCYAMSLAPVTWVLISEIFPNRVRGAAVSVAVSALWIACFILTYTFPVLNQRFGPAGTFWLYAAVCLAGLIFIITSVPETKGKTLEQIEREIAS